MKRVAKSPSWASLVHYWRLFSELAWSHRSDNTLKALALAWAHEPLSDKTAGWVFTFGIRSLCRGWLRAVKRKAQMLDMRFGQHTEKNGTPVDTLLVPQMGKIYHCAPCFALGKEVEKRSGVGSVGILTPAGTTRDEFASLAYEYGYTGRIVELDLTPCFWVLPFFLTAVVKYLRIIFSSNPPEIRRFFLHQPLRRLQQLFSSELLIRRFKMQLKDLKVKKLITMQEQHFPGSLLVAAANDLGIETNQILHGGFPSQLCVPFQCSYLWPEYEWTAKGLKRLGAPPERLKVVSGLQAGSQLNRNRIQLGHKFRCVSRNLRVLFLAQYCGYSETGIDCFKDALETVFEAVATRSHVWQLAIRPHPWDSEEDLNNIKGTGQRFGSFWMLTDSTIDLAEEAARSHLVVTATSTGIFTAIASGTPACLIWGSDQTIIHGDPPLSDDWVARRCSDLAQILDRVSNGGPSAVPGMAAEQAKALSLDDLIDAPKRFCDALFENDKIEAISVAGSTKQFITSPSAMRYPQR